MDASVCVQCIRKVFEKRKERNIKCERKKFLASHYVGNACLPIVEFMALFWHDSNCCSVHIPIYFWLIFCGEKISMKSTGDEQMYICEFSENVIKVFATSHNCCWNVRKGGRHIASTYHKWVLSRDSKLFVENVVEVDKHITGKWRMRQWHYEIA